VEKRYIVELTDEERMELRHLINRGKSAARKVRRAQVLLLADEGKTDQQISEAAFVAVTTVGRLRKRFVEEGLEAALSEQPRPGAAPKLQGKDTAMLVALACSDPPQGRQRWTLQLLADRLVELKVVDAISDESVRRTLKKTRSSRG